MAPKLLSHELELLSDAASHQLFRQSAGRQDATDAGPAGLEDSIVRACGGVPLALRLAGGVLRQEGDADMWKVRNLSHMHVPAGHMGVVCMQVSGSILNSCVDAPVPCREC
jgi:hypothetical protein